VRQVSILLLIVHPVPDDENIRNLKASVSYRQVNDSSGRLVEQRADVYASRPALFERPQEVACGQSGVDYILNQKHISIGDTIIKIFGDANYPRASLTGVTGDSHEVYGARNFHRAKQICSEDERAF